ncbi:DUF445 domain-containing protein [Bowmanella pacifica]|uniref:DUF445 domain-containing protein n=1 Tax=Bowmanella pacifica TaxID=502051 RepID=A0A917Z2U4_9ALTE|nr:DUF445 family protein [Bowmanella pacifica]GGO73473.1 hypothetical protein GCM10010982_34040 [Bowmanella pacifica]
MEWTLETLLLLLIPLTSALVGWFTNYLAVKMMFYPVEFVGIRPIFGWQGLIPAKRRKMAEIEVELVLGKLLSVEEIVNRLDAQQMTLAIERRLKQVLRRIVNDVMQASAPTLWAALPVQGKNLVYARVELDIPNVVSKMVRDFQQNVTEIFDIREMVVEQLAKDPELINEIFLKAGAKEFPFIERSGLYFGFLFGLPSMFIWSYYQLWWILPLGGLLVGYATNWIAIKIIFEPKRPRKVGFFTLQGMFLKRQKEVSRVYAEIIEKKLLNSQNITHAVLKGAGSGQLLELIELHVNDAIERYVAVAQPYFALAVGSEDYFRMKEMAVKRIFEDSDKFLHYAHEYANSALNIGDDLRVKMEALSPEEFEGVLRPAYKQDEWKLIVVGAILGMLAGTGQLYLMLL